MSICNKEKMTVCLSSRIPWWTTRVEVKKSPEHGIWWNADRLWQTALSTPFDTAMMQRLPLVRCCVNVSKGGERNTHLKSLVVCSPVSRLHAGAKHSALPSSTAPRSTESLLARAKTVVLTNCNWWKVVPSCASAFTQWQTSPEKLCFWSNQRIRCCSRGCIRSESTAWR